MAASFSSRNKTSKQFRTFLAYPPPNSISASSKTTVRINFTYGVNAPFLQLPSRQSKTSCSARAGVQTMMSGNEEGSPRSGVKATVLTIDFFSESSSKSSGSVKISMAFFTWSHKCAFGHKISAETSSLRSISFLFKIFETIGMA